MLFTGGNILVTTVTNFNILVTTVINELTDFLDNRQNRWIHMLENLSIETKFHTICFDRYLSGLSLGFY